MRALPTAAATAALAVCVAAVAACSETTPPTSAVERAAPVSEVDLSKVGTEDVIAHTALSGGATTVFDETATAFGHPAPNLDANALALHEIGDEAFEGVFDVAPPSEHLGLGPVFDHVSCEGCHVGDGRAQPPADGRLFNGFLFRASVPGKGPHGGPKPVPGGLGGQLQLRAIAGFRPDAVARVRYTELQGTFGDGTTFSLRVPHYKLTAPPGGVPLPANLRFSPRVAPVNFGLGLLEAIPDALLLLRADPSDRDRDGISGRVNISFDAVHQRTAIGRFGWKAAVPTLLQQGAGAYNGDMGITTNLFAAEACEGILGCERHDPELDDATAAATAFYAQTLGVPARRRLDDPQATAGELIFHAVGCAKCHVATQVTGVLPGVPAVSRQIIHPYTDLLLHDMGPGLADNRPDFSASGREWRTPPLWGIGLVRVVNGHTTFLHDGRARSLLEAILWHGGEALRAREAVRNLPASQRAQLIAFLESL
jgi:CxxC motif-containing protein (DUF1111 family)